MKKIKEIATMLSPFNNLDEMPAGVYVIKKLLAFFVIFMGAALVGEGIVIAGLSICGYDFLHGEMPKPIVMDMITYYGYVIHISFVILYCKFVEKRSIVSSRNGKKVFDYLLGAGIATVLLAVIMVFTCALGGASYEGIGKSFNVLSTVALLGGFIIQGAAEEFLCRGFLLTTLQKKLSLPLAVFISSTVFAYPHFSALFEAEGKTAVIGVVNLYLVSVIFSLLMVCRKNIWIACGLHSIWNFILYAVLGLNLSGKEGQNTGIICFYMNKSDIINGGQYGIEAGVVTTAVLTTVVIVICMWMRKIRMNENGV